MDETLWIVVEPFSLAIFFRSTSFPEIAGVQCLDTSNFFDWSNGKELVFMVNHHNPVTRKS